jgi:glycerol-3-phosphate acyltransferase PlsY
MGIAGVVGHCLPVFHGFKGGGGIGTMQGVSLFFIPVEYLVSMLIGGTIVLLFFKKVQYKYGQWTPIMFVTLTPFMTLLTTLTLDIPLFAHISIGGHPWSIVAGSFVLSFTILGLNINFMRSRADELKSIEGEEQED